jgi:predicted secreted hydrolase
LEAIHQEMRQAIELRHLHGANSPSSLEWWYFTGFMWRNNNNASCDTTTDIANLASKKTPHYSVQSTFFLADEMTPKGLLAHAAEADLEKKQHRSSERVAGFAQNSMSSPIAFAAPGLLNLTIGNWRLSQLGSSKERVHWDLRFDVRGTEYLLQLKIPKSDFWFHGKNGFLQKTSGAGNFYYSAPFVVASGQRIYRDPSGINKLESICGQLWFDHEIHVKKVMDVGWRWFGLNFSNGKSLMIYQISEKGKFTQAKGEIWDQSTKTSTLLDQINLSASNEVCLSSQRCYPQTFQAEFLDPSSKVKNVVKTDAWFAEQEMGSASGALGRPYWEGAVRAVWDTAPNISKKNRQPTEGIGFIEMVPQEPGK